MEVVGRGKTNLERKLSEAALIKNSGPDKCVSIPSVALLNNERRLTGSHSYAAFLPLLLLVFCASSLLCLLCMLCTFDRVLMLFIYHIS